MVFGTGDKNTGCLTTLCNNFRIRFLASYQVRNVMSAWDRFTTVTKVWDFEM